MAKPSSKAAKAPDPPSSSSSNPTNTRSYAFREGSYYTDDQSDGCYGDDYGGAGVSTHADYDGSESDDDSQTGSSHEQRCALHADPLTTHCNALTQTGKKCSRKAKVITQGYFPVCMLHDRYWAVLRAGRCQAVEECGRVCNRFAPHAPPYHLCAKHEQGTDTLPCGIMSLPTELHLMIFRHLFPAIVHPEGLPRYAGAVLRVNRTFYQVASMIVYNELEFRASINRIMVSFLGRTWYANHVDGKYPNINKAFCQSGAQRIRKLQIEVRFAHENSRAKGIGAHGISQEDHELYQVRDVVRAFVEMLSPATKSRTSTKKPNLRQIEIRPVAGLIYFWQVDEAVAALFFVLEPFTALGPIEEPSLLPCPKVTHWSNRHQTYANIIENLHKDDTYRQLRESWLELMTSKLSTPNYVRREGKWKTLITDEYHKIKNLKALIEKQESSTGTKHGWMSNAFQGIERALHIARVIDMNITNNDKAASERMSRICEAISKRWVNGHREHQRSISAIADCISSLSHPRDKDPKEIYPDAFEFETLDPIKQGTPMDHSWSELGAPDTAPSILEGGVSYFEDDFRVCIFKDDKAYVRLKTPQVIRQLRKFK